MVVSSSDNFVARGFVQPPALPRNLFAQGAVQGTFLDLDLFQLLAPAYTVMWLYRQDDIPSLICKERIISDLKEH